MNPPSGLDTHPEGGMKAWEGRTVSPPNCVDSISRLWSGRYLMHLNNGSQTRSYLAASTAVDQESPVSIAKWRLARATLGPASESGSLKGERG
jgi:hypothetical protein